MDPRWPFDKLLAVSVSAASGLTGDPAVGSQLGTLMAGAHMLTNDEVPVEDEMIERMVDLGLETYGEELRRSGGEKVVALLMKSQVAVRREGAVATMATVADLIRSVVGEAREPEYLRSPRQVERWLAMMGFAVDSEEAVVHVAHETEWLDAATKGTRFRKGRWRQALRMIPGVVPGKRRYCGGPYLREVGSMTVPLNLLL